MRYLVDANVLSEPTKKLPNARVVAWLRDNERELAVDLIMLGELRFGILLRRNGRRRTSLERWFDAGVQRLRCLPWEAETGLRPEVILVDREIVHPFMNYPTLIGEELRPKCHVYAPTLLIKRC